MINCVSRKQKTQREGKWKITNFQSSSITGKPVILFSTRISSAVANRAPIRMGMQKIQMNTNSLMASS